MRIQVRQNPQNPQTSQTITINQAISEFIKHCEAKNLSAASVRYYKDGLNRFSMFTDTRKDVDTICKSLINDYIIYIQQELKVCDISAQSYTRSVRAFCYYLMNEEYIDRFKIRLPKATEKIKTTYTKDELLKLLKKPDMKHCTFSEFRTWVYVNYLLGTGNRLNSVKNICIGDIDFTDGYVTLRKTKNKTEQVIPISADLSKVLKEYLSIRCGEADDYLFCSDTGRKLSDEGLQSALDRYCEKRGVKPRGSHALRHSFAKMYLLNGGDIFRLQKLLGHKDISVTRKYLDLLPEDLKQDYNKLNPLDSLHEQQRQQNSTKIVMRRGNAKKL